MIVPGQAGQQSVLRPLLSEGRVHARGGEDWDAPDRGEPGDRRQNVGTDGAEEEVRFEEVVWFLPVDHVHGRQGSHSGVTLSVRHQEVPGKLPQGPGGVQDGGQHPIQAGQGDPALLVI